MSPAHEPADAVAKGDIVYEALCTEREAVDVFVDVEDGDGESVPVKLIEPVKDKTAVVVKVA